MNRDQYANLRRMFNDVQVAMNKVGIHMDNMEPAESPKLRVEEGKYYQTENGGIVGPMVWNKGWYQGKSGWFYIDSDHATQWNEDGADLYGSTYGPLIAEVPAPVQDKETAKVSGWWCPNCRKIVPPVEVTFQEYHTVCECQVLVSPAPLQESTPEAQVSHPGVAMHHLRKAFHALGLTESKIDEIMSVLIDENWRPTPPQGKDEKGEEA